MDSTVCAGVSSSWRNQLCSRQRLGRFFSTQRPDKIPYSLFPSVFFLIDDARFKFNNCLIETKTKKTQQQDPKCPVNHAVWARGRRLILKGICISSPRNFWTVIIYIYIYIHICMCVCARVCVCVCVFWCCLCTLHVSTACTKDSTHGFNSCN